MISVRLRAIQCLAAILLPTVLTGCTSGDAQLPQIDVQIEEVLRISGEPLVGDDSTFGFGTITAMEADAAGNLYVLDQSLLQIRKFSSDGESVLTIQMIEGDGPGEIRQPSDIAIGDRENVYVLSRATREVLTFGASGEFVNRFSIRFYPTQLGVNGGHVFITSLWIQRDSIMHVFSETGEEQRSLLPRPENWQEVFATGNFGKYAFSSTGNLLYSYPTPYRIIEIGENGEIIRESQGEKAFDSEVEAEASTSGTTNLILEGRPRSLAISEGGFILNVIQDGEDYYVDIFSAELVFLKRIPASDFGLDEIRLMTADGRGNVFFNESFDALLILKFKLDIRLNN